MLMWAKMSISEAHRKFGHIAVGLVHDSITRSIGRSGPSFEGSEILRQRGYPEELRRAILGHADYTGVPRERCWPRRCLRATSWRASSPPARWCGRTASSASRRIRTQANEKTKPSPARSAGRTSPGCRRTGRAARRPHRLLHRRHAPYGRTPRFDATRRQQSFRELCFMM